MLLTGNCNYDCSFCIEKTEEDTKDDSSVDTFLRKANHLIDNSLVDEVLLLGGEPLFYRHILEIIDGLHLKPIITTNGYRLADDSFRGQVDFDKIKAMNISLPHYGWDKRKEIMNRRGLSNEDLERVVKNVGIPVRMNTVLMRDYIWSEEEVNAMIEFARKIGFKSVKFSEITGTDEKIYDFIKREVVRFNQSQQTPIPFQEMYETCHKLGGSHFYANVGGVDVHFSSAPVFKLSGGKDKEGKYYHAILFNDGMLGFSWNRRDGVYQDGNQFLQIVQKNQR